MSADLAGRFLEATGSSHYLTAEDAQSVAAYLEGLGYLYPGERVMMVVAAGAGNMNLTLRVTTGRRRFIVKQSRPWVAKFPELAAPVERVLIERDFHRMIVKDRLLSGRMPEIFKADAKNFILIMEDLGRAGDLSDIYGEGKQLSRTQLRTLLQFAARLHGMRVTPFPDNLDLRRLNHAHIFDLPFRADNGFPLEAIHPGLAAVARPYQHDARLREAALALGERYLAPGETLVHGDYYPGSFLEVDSKVYVIDAEFAHLGRAEFDVGVLMAHLLLSRATEERILQIDRDYTKPAGFSVELARRFCYVEVIRRLIGIAQLPLAISLDERRSLLDRARSGLLN